MSQPLADSIRGPRVGVVANAYELAPWADFLAATDRAWWEHYPSARAFAGRRFTARRMPGIEHLASAQQNWSSGVLALEAAASLGATVIRLYGFDMHGTHFFGPYTNGLVNTTDKRREVHMRQFAAWAMAHPGVRVINCTPGSALKCFDVESLPVAAPAPVVVVNGMHGMGDNLHQRAVVRELMREHTVWLETPWPSIYHDIIGPRLHVVSRGSTLRTQAKNAAREAALFDKATPPPGRSVAVNYPPASVRQHRGVLAAMSARCGVLVGDFRLPVPASWAHGLALPTNKPVLVVRPLVERTEWGGCRNRNPDLGAWLAVYRQLRQQFFVVSVADLVPGKEWMAHEDLRADLTLHAGELDFRQLAALWRDASLVLTAPGFGLVLSQAIGTPVVGVFGGYESGYSFSAGAAHTPTLCIEPQTPCDCFSHSHPCNKSIDLETASRRLQDFVHAHCIHQAQPAFG
jgi:hypothetical protein